MASTPPGFLGDYPVLDIGQGWTFRHGTSPGFGIFEMIPEDADALLSGPLVPVTLTIDNVEIKNLLPLVKSPTFNPNVTRVLVADRRWYWQQLIVDDAFNQRRHIGVRRVTGAAGTPTETRPIVADVDYEPWSLQSRNQPWDAIEVLEDVVKRVIDLEKDAGLNLGGYRLDMTGLQTTIEVENLNLSGTAATGINQILRYIPSMRLSLTNDGTIKLYSFAGADEEKDIIDNMGAEFWDEGTVAEMFTSFRRVRPKEVRVFFDIEAEVRFDFEERSRAGVFTTASFDGRTCDNVLAVTDYRLTGHRLGQMTQGTWVRIDQDLFNAWRKMPFFNTVLTFGQLFRLMLPHHDFHFGQAVRAGSFVAEADWAGRFQSIKQHWRTTYRINRRWVDRYRRIYPYRVATADPVTATRAPAMAWFNYFVQGTQRLLNAGIVGIGGGQGSPYGFNVECLPKGLQTTLDSNADIIAAPVSVEVIDSDQGIIGYQFRHDMFRQREIFMPGLIKNIPSRSDIDGLAWNAYVQAGRTPTTIDGDFAAIFLMTLSPGTARNRRHLFEVVIGPNDVRSVMPSKLRAGLGEAQGPPVEIKIGAGIETARIAWSDRRFADIEAIFGLGDKKPELEDLCVNYLKNNLGASIWSIAVAAAAQIYAGYADRHQGNATTSINSELEMTGLMEEMSHRIDPDGAAVTEISMENWSDFSLDPQSMMPQATRRFINRTAEVAR